MGNQIILPDGTPLTLLSGTAKEVGDGNHTFEELYEHRICLFLAFLESVPPELKWKSLRHNDNSPMFEDSFLCGCNLPLTGKQITYHIPLQYFNFCNCKELPYAPPWDQHTSFDVLDRLVDFINFPKPSPDFDLFFQKDKNPLTWVGFDFDGSIATYSRSKAADPVTGKHDKLWLGEPIFEAIDLLKQWMNKGVLVKILTARVSKLPFLEKDESEQLLIGKLQDWCLKHIGTIVPITCCKDKDMFCLYDDRAIQLIKNMGIRRT